jgi:hypothetical protein
MKDIFSKLVSKTINDEINRVSSSILTKSKRVSEIYISSSCIFK